MRKFKLEECKEILKSITYYIFLSVTMGLKDKRAKASQEQIGQYLGVSTPAVNKWEKGYTYPDVSLLPALARLLMSLAEIEIKEGDSQNASHLAELSQKVIKLFELGDMQALATPLQVAILQKNIEESISLLKAYFSATFKLWDVSKSSLYSHIAADRKTVKTVKEELVEEKKNTLGKQLRLTLLSELENNPEYIFLHSNTEFRQFIKKYRSEH